MFRQKRRVVLFECKVLVYVQKEVNGASRLVHDFKSRPLAIEPPQDLRHWTPARHFKVQFEPTVAKVADFGRRSTLHDSRVKRCRARSPIK